MPGNTPGAECSRSGASYYVYDGLERLALRTTQNMTPGNYGITELRELRAELR
jgi:hypothetical protein